MKQTPFKVPNDYFDNNLTKWEQQMQNERKPFLNPFKTWLFMAASFLLIIGVGYGLINVVVNLDNNNNNNVIYSDVVIKDEIYQAVDYYDVSEDMIVDYILTSY